VTTQRLKPALRQEPTTGRLAQWLPMQVSRDDGGREGTPIPGSERWVVVWCQPGSGISMQVLTDDEADAWTPVEVRPL
jgi:hypothetical protein